MSEPEYTTRVGEAKCPYCNMANQYLFDQLSKESTTTAICDTDNGGCGKTFAVGTQVLYSHKVYKLTEVEQE